MKKTIINHDVNLYPLQIKNNEREKFRADLNKIPYLLYEVETLKDGKKVVINKLGGKRNFGKLAQNDLMVFIYSPIECELWLISHNEIFEDIKQKYEYNKNETLKLINALKEVCEGKEPDEALIANKVRRHYWT